MVCPDGGCGAAGAEACAAGVGGCCWFFVDDAGKEHCSNEPPPLELAVTGGDLVRTCRCVLDSDSPCAACNASQPCVACKAGYSLIASSQCCTLVPAPIYDDHNDGLVAAIVIPLVVLLMCGLIIAYTRRATAAPGDSPQFASYTAVYGSLLASKGDAIQPTYKRVRTDSEYAHYSHFASVGADASIQSPVER
ncbi:uncharacterized protein AMSG_00183 [Thecamonas trahens ATCC 50062]|uniref:Uncharacterized protein n=1 Tax=Thecamonas trahens ATCC 50062 TaxID=461836 RepID=A0A0L0D1T6_THETB|nr:hypothetical protein AMSG_00183 [Thecamonas trahens ATCC 50062]KNC46065.1 hypothetical protein AMSG_00183 [Thecamonas trahens ATCC 50062]|eukprot:XP_013763045.1 hypothetical protein AMSG_00183 [Thecamonas trahens ATCC 50062]